MRPWTNAQDCIIDRSADQCTLNRYDATVQMLDQTLQPDLPGHWYTLLNMSGEAFVLTDKEGRIVLFTRSAEEIFGFSSAEVLGQSVSLLMPARFRQRHPQLMRSFRRDGRAPRFMGDRAPIIGVRQSGEEFPAEASIAWLPQAGPGLFAVILRDVSDRVRQERDTTRLLRIIEESTDEIYVFDMHGWSLRQVNRAARSNLGYHPDEMQHLTMLDVQPTFTPRSFASFIQPLADGEVKQLSYDSIHQRRNGSTYDVEVRIERIQDDTPPTLVANVRDVTEQRRYEAIIQRQSHYDPVTMLPNRSAFLASAEHAAQKAVKQGTQGAVLVVGLEKTDLVRDGLGTSAGESVSQQIGNRLSAAVRGQQMVARVGDAEYAILAPTVRDMRDAEAVAHAVQARLTPPLEADDLTLMLKSRIGIAIFPDNGIGGDELLRQAHGAMIQARALDRGPYQFATRALNQAIGERIRMESALGKALERSEFSLVFQPTVRTTDRSICGAEALLRWTPPKDDPVRPDVFIPILEETGLIHAVGDWVIKAVFSEARRLRQDGIHGVRLALNLSMRQLTSGLPNLLQDCLTEAGIPGSAITIELTESSLMRNVDESLDILNRIAELGIGMAIDDFGCGYSSLSYLRRLPLTTLKIDRSFVRDMDTNPDAAAIAKTIVAMAQALRLRTVAEGVETETQLTLLRDLGCDEVQGFHLFRPMPIEALRRQLVGPASEPTPAPRCDRRHGRTAPMQQQNAG